MGQHLAGMLHQHAQQFVFLGRQLDLAVADLDDTAHQVDREVAGPEHRPLAMDLQLMPQRRAHAGEQFIHPERLGQVIVGAEIERLDLAGLVAAARQHHDRHAVVAAADHAQQFVALDIRQAEIENDQCRVLREQFQRQLAVGGFEDLIALRAKPHPQQLADRRFIVDDHDFYRRGVHAAVSSALEAAGIGRRMVSTAPLRSARFAAKILPCIASTNPREIASPSPVPGRTWSPFCAR